MTTKRVSSSPGSHGLLETKFSGPSGKHTKRIRAYFTARGKPDNYQYTPAEGREAMNYIKHVDRMASGDSWGSGSSFLPGASSYDETFKYKDPIQEVDYPKFLAEQDSEALDDLAMDDASESTSGIDDISSSEPDPYKQKYTSNLSGGLLDSEALDDLAMDEASGEPGPSLLDYDEDLEAFDSNPVSEKSWWEELTESGGESKGLSPMQKYGAKMITDIFSEKEERPQQSIGASPLTPGRSLDMSKYITSRPKKERYRNMGLLGRA